MLAIEAFNYKVNTDITGRAFGKLRRAFPSRLGDLPNEPAVRKVAAALSGFCGREIHCCINSCVAYTGAYTPLDQCPHCGEERYKPARNNRVHRAPRCIFLYLPILPRLRNLYRDSTLAQKLRHRAERDLDPANIRDIFDGAHYNRLCGERVAVGGDVLGHHYFSQPTDIALGLSSDGFGPFKSRQKSCWPLLAFNYNLPPTIRTRLENVICLGVVPGPSSPKEIDTFLEPFIDELEDLARGVPAYDAAAGHPITLHAYLLACFGDMPAVAKLMCMKGPNGKHPCRACDIEAVHPEEGDTTNYTPLKRTFVSGAPGPSSYDPLNLPLRSHIDFLEQALYVESAENDAVEERRSRETGINSLSPLARISSLNFPRSFPHDFMHAMFENVVPMLLDLWSRSDKWKTFGNAHEDYHIPPDTWKAIGKACVASGNTIPSAFGCRIPNLAESRRELTAESRCLFATQVGPALLRGQTRYPRFYQHFIRLVGLINTCLRIEITRADLQRIRAGFARWVQDFERFVPSFTRIFLAD